MVDQYSATCFSYFPIPYGLHLGIDTLQLKLRMESLSWDLMPPDLNDIEAPMLQSIQEVHYLYLQGGQEEKAIAENLMVRSWMGNRATGLMHVVDNLRFVKTNYVKVPLGKWNNELSAYDALVLLEGNEIIKSARGASPQKLKDFRFRAENRAVIREPVEVGRRPGLGPARK